MTGQLLQQRLDSILSFIETSAKQGVAFAQEQTPELVQQLLAWKLAENTLEAIVSFVAFFGIIAALRKFPVLYRDDDILPPGLMGWIFVFVILLLVFVAAVSNVLQILIAPKIYLIEYAASFLQ
jgi:hypothetical protein